MSQAAVAEMIALLTCRSPDVLAGGGGGAAKFTQHDVAALMHGLAFEEAELVRVKYGLEPSSRLWSWWLRHLALMGWGDKDGRLQALVELTLEECINPDVCRLCKGICTLPGAGTAPPTTCPQCDGLGRNDFSTRSIAKRLGFTSRLNKPWDQRLIDARAMLKQIEYAGLEKMVSNRSRK